MNERHIFQCVAIAILISFYSIYLGKMIRQRFKGIQTDQMARGKKNKRLFLTELSLKITTFCIVLVEIGSIFINGANSIIMLRIAGAILGIAGVVLFGIAVYTMRDNWRAGIPDTDKTGLVVSGIFKFSRNPAFLAFDLVYIGILLMFFNWVLLAFTMLAITLLHLQILQEEKYLSSIFGEEYEKYRRQTGRYF